MSAPKSDTATIEARKSRLLELLTEGKTLTEAREILKEEGYPASKKTLQRMVNGGLASEWREQNMTDFEVWRGEHIAELEKLRTQLQDFLIPPEKRIELALKIIAQDAKLKGTEAPSKSISATVNVNPEHSEDYLLFREACAGLSEEQIHDVRLYAKALPRTWVAPPIEVNFPPMKALPEATDEAQ